MKKSNHTVGTTLDDYLHDRLRKKSFKVKFEKAKLKVSVGQMVQRIALQNKLSLRTLAKKMGSSLSQVQRLMEDENITISTLRKFADATGKKLEIRFR